MDTITICAIFKNEARYLLEWIGFHRMIGVDHFVLYDNASIDGGPALLRGSPFARHVTLIDWPMPNGQLPAYADFIANHARRFTWAAFIDLDEFIHPLEAETLRPLLPRYSGFSGVLLHWLLFGPSGHDASPEGLTIGNHLFRMADEAPVNQHVRSLLRTRDLVSADTTPHLMICSGPVCNTRGERVPSQVRHDPPCHDAIVVNHYLTGSAEDRRADVARAAPVDRFGDIVRDATVADRRITRFMPRLAWVLRDAPAGTD